MKQVCLEHIAQSMDKGLTIEEIKKATSTTSKTQLTNLMKTLNELVEDVEVVFDQRQRYVLPRYVNVYTGTLKLNKKGFGFVEFPDKVIDDVYINTDELNQAMHNDTVIVRVVSGHGQTFGQIMKIKERGTKYLIGAVRKKKNRWILEPDDQRIFLPVYISDAANHKLVDGHKIRLEIKEYSSNELVGKVSSILGHVNEPGVDVLSILTEFEIFPEFNEAVMAQIEKIPPRVMSYQKKNRTNLTDTWICTIDGADAKDLDDAISIKRTDTGYELGVHIADVSYYVKENSPIDHEAYVRGTSVYVVDRVVPMLPHHLSNGVCSLHPHVDRLTLSCVMNFDFKGNILDYKLFPSVIRSQARMTYSDVNLILEGDEEILKKYVETSENFLLMHELSLKIRKLKEKRGAIDFDTSESLIEVDKQGHVLDIRKRERFEAERIIEDFMISANECVASHMHHLELPFIYRIHEQPEAKKIRDFAKIATLMGFKYKGSANNVFVKDFQTLLNEAKDSEAFPVLSMWMLRSMSKARYDVNCLGHFGLASENYTHFTSPIRRYPDLIVHRMLRKYVFQNVADTDVIHNDIAKMTDVAMQSSNRERAAVDAERAVEAMKKAEFFEDKVNMIFNGVVSSVTNFGLFVELENTVEGLVHIQSMYDDYYHYDASKMSLVGERTQKQYRLGQKVRVRVKSASKKNSTIDFELVKSKIKNPRKRWE